MSKKPDKPDETITPPIEPVTPPKPPADPEKPISIMGEPKPPVKSEETVTLKSFTELKDAFVSLEKKLDEYIPKPPVITPTPEPKKYRLFDEFEVI